MTISGGGTESAGFGLRYEARPAPMQAAIRHWREVPVTTWYQRRGKRYFDLLAGTVLMILCVPLFLVVAAVVAATMGLPILYTQDRPGLHGESFRIYKFRTMGRDRRTGTAPFAGPDRRSTWKTPEDPRHTRVGRFLRSTSLDELPQLVNVVRGQMALVGPRPEILELAVEAGILDHPRHAYRPGITGLWQVEDRSQGELEAKLALDTRYVSEVSFLTDLRLLLRTPIAVVRRRGE